MAELRWVRGGARLRLGAERCPNHLRRRQRFRRRACASGVVPAWADREVLRGRRQVGRSRLPRRGGRPNAGGRRDDDRLPWDAPSRMESARRACASRRTGRRQAAARGHRAAARDRSRVPVRLVRPPRAQLPASLWIRPGIHERSRHRTVRRLDPMPEHGPPGRRGRPGRARLSLSGPPTRPWPGGRRWPRSDGGDRPGRGPSGTYQRRRPAARGRVPPHPPQRTRDRRPVGARRRRALGGRQAQQRIHAPRRRRRRGCPAGVLLGANHRRAPRAVLQPGRLVRAARVPLPQPPAPEGRAGPAGLSLHRSLPERQRRRGQCQVELPLPRRGDRARPEHSLAELAGSVRDQLRPGADRAHAHRS